MIAPGTARGRPRVTSRRTLQEAAFELFLERGYAHTSVERIATRAGVSRATFFNHFAAKSDVFWVDVDQRIDQLRDELGQIPSAAGARALDVVIDALLRLTAGVAASSVPWVLTQGDLVGAQQELQASALTRLARFTDTVTAFLRRQHPDAAALAARTAGFAIAGAVIAAAEAWAAAGSGRGELTPLVRLALQPVLALGPALEAVAP